MLHGSQHWFHSVSQFVPSPVRALASITQGSPSPLLGWTSFALESTQLSSVVNGIWHLLAQWMPLDFAIPHPSYQRTLQHILNAAESPPQYRDAMPSASDDISGLLFSAALPVMGHLPKARPFTTVCCPSVFIKTGWIARPLSTVELGRAYDIPTQVVSQFAMWPP